MELVRISKTTLDLIRANRDLSKKWRETAKPRADGDYDIPLSDDVVEAIAARKHPHETYDEAIFRFLTTAGKGIQ